jgi:hypothetical protein
MATVVTDPDLIRRVREAAGQRPAAQPSPTIPPTGGRVVTDPGVIQGVKNRARLQDAAKKRALAVGQDMPEAPDRISQAFDVAAQGPSGRGLAFGLGGGDSAALGFGMRSAPQWTFRLQPFRACGQSYDATCRRRQLLSRRRHSILAPRWPGSWRALWLRTGVVAAKGAGLGTRLYGWAKGLPGAVYGAGSGRACRIVL